MELMNRLPAELSNIVYSYLGPHKHAEIMKKLIKEGFEDFNCNIFEQIDDKFYFENTIINLRILLIKENQLILHRDDLYEFINNISNFVLWYYYILHYRKDKYIIINVDEILKNSNKFVKDFIENFDNEEDEDVLLDEDTDTDED